MARRPRRASPPRPIGSLFTRALTRQAPPSDQVRDRIAELGGTQAAAAQLGRSERTIRRWAQTGKVPTRGGAADSLDQAVQAHRGTPQYRQQQVGSRRDSRMRRHGARFTFRGRAGPINDSPGASIRTRTIDVHLSGEAMADILDAYTARGEAAGLQVLSDAVAREYMGDTAYGWHFDSSAGRMDFLRHSSF